MFYSNLIGSHSCIIPWLEVWAYNQFKMKELSIVFVAPLSCPCKTVNIRFPVLVTLGVYHVKRNSGYCMISPVWQGDPFKGDSSLPRSPPWVVCGCNSACFLEWTCHDFAWVLSLVSDAYINMHINGQNGTSGRCTAIDYNTYLLFSNALFLGSLHSSLT